MEAFMEARAIRRGGGTLPNFPFALPPCTTELAFAGQMQDQSKRQIDEDRKLEFEYDIVGFGKGSMHMFFWFAFVSERDGLDWDGIGLNAMGSNGIEWYRMQWTAMKREGNEWERERERKGQ